MPILLKSLLNEYVPGYIEDEDEDEQPLKSVKDILALIPQIVAAAQSQYDTWDQSNPDMDELCGGGICHLIADEIAGVLNQNGIDATTVSAQVGEQHVWTVAKVKEGVYEIDIPPSVYESGGGYTWTKTADVQFGEGDIVVNRLSSNPKDFKDYTDQF